MLLAFLNLGASEIALILVLLLLLFGADKLPEMARTMGKARAQLDSAQRQFSEAIRTDDERAFDEQVAFERERERKIAEAQALEDPELVALTRAAAELGLQTQGRSKDELRAAIRDAMGGASAGEKKSA